MSAEAFGLPGMPFGIDPVLSMPAKAEQPRVEARAIKQRSGARAEHFDREAARKKGRSAKAARKRNRRK